MIFLQFIPTNPFEYGALALLAGSYIVAIRWFVNREEKLKIEHTQAIKDKKAEYLLLIERKEAELKECREELKAANDQRFDIVKQNIELSMELMNAIEDFKNSKNGNSGDKQKIGR